MDPGTLAVALTCMLEHGVDTILITDFSGGFGPTLTDLALTMMYASFNPHNPSGTKPILTVSYAQGAEEYSTSYAPDWFVPFDSRRSRVLAIAQLCISQSWQHVAVWADSPRFREDPTTPLCNQGNIKVFCVASMVVVSPTQPHARMVQQLEASIREGWQVACSSCVVLRCVALRCVVLYCVVLCCVVLCRRRCYQKAKAGMSTHGYR